MEKQKKDLEEQKKDLVQQKKTWSSIQKLGGAEKRLGGAERGKVRGKYWEEEVNRQLRLMNTTSSKAGSQEVKQRGCKRRQSIMFTRKREKSIVTEFCDENKIGVGRCRNHCL